VAEADVTLVRELYERFNAGELERVREILSEDIEWVEPVGYFVPEAAGTTRGLDAVFAVFARYPELWESFAPTPQEFYDAGDGTIFVIGRTARADIRRRRRGGVVRQPVAGQGWAANRAPLMVGHENARRRARALR
jgi:ketosteroid isomerase-like protein